MGRRLIDADTIVHWQSYDDETESYPEHTGTIADFLDQMTDEGCPEAVDAVPVVRCRDCKNYRYYPYSGSGIDGFCLSSDWYKRPMNTDDYCSNGERKDGEQHD